MHARCTEWTNGQSLGLFLCLPLFGEEEMKEFTRWKIVCSRHRLSQQIFQDLCESPWQQAVYCVVPVQDRKKGCCIPNICKAQHICRCLMKAMWGENMVNILQIHRVSITMSGSSILMTLIRNQSSFNIIPLFHLQQAFLIRSINLYIQISMIYVWKKMACS